MGLTLLVLGLSSALGAEVPVVGVDEPAGATHQAVDLPGASPPLSSAQRKEVRRAYGRAQRGATRTFISMGMMTGAALWFSVSEDGYYVPGPGMLFSPVLGAVGVGFMVSGLVTSVRSSPVILREGRLSAPNQGVIARGDVASLVLQSTVFAFAAHRAVNEDPWGTLGVSAAFLLPAAATAIHLRTLRRASAELGVKVGRSRASDLQVAMGPTSVSVRW